jgi:hypothetical protein
MAAMIFQAKVGIFMLSPRCCERSSEASLAPSRFVPMSRGLRFNILSCRLWNAVGGKLSLVGTTGSDRKQMAASAKTPPWSRG